MKNYHYREKVQPTEKKKNYLTLFIKYMWPPKLGRERKREGEREIERLKVLEIEAR